MSGHCKGSKNLYREGRVETSGGKRTSFMRFLVEYGTMPHNYASKSKLYFSPSVNPA